MHTLAGAYALNALEEEGLRRFEEHLAYCESCAQEVRGLTETAALLGTAAARRPPQDLRRRVLDEVSRTRQLAPAPVPLAIPRRWWQKGMGLGLAASLLLAVVLGGVAANQYRELSEMRQNEREVALVLAAPDARTTSAQPAEGVSVSVVTSHSRGRLVFSAEGLDRLDDEDYQLWLARPGGSVRSAGILAVDSDGSARPLVATGADEAEGVAMTVEPEGGSPQPTTAPMMEMPLEG